MVISNRTINISKINPNMKMKSPPKTMKANFCLKVDIGTNLIKKMG
jgi:hypothetical protein